MQRGGHFLYEEARCPFNELIDHEAMERNRRIADLQNKTQLAI
ncbi:hypothetical protein [Parageobacillus genomosp. 1]|nr:hypothetical protein [Parageobacillus genomosp. 1]